MGYSIRIAAIVVLIIVSPNTFPDTITDTYNTGDTLTATTLDNIKSAVNDNDSSINTNSSLIGGKQDRVSGSCTPGSSINAINIDGTVVCEEIMIPILPIQQAAALP